MSAAESPERILGGDLLLAVGDGIATVIFNRPDVRNAVSFEMWRALPALFAGLADDPAVRGVVVRGAGEQAFASGADISELPGAHLLARAPGDSSSPDAELETRRVTVEQAKVYGAVHEAAVTAIARCPKPTVAMIHGYCLGGGAAVAAACDLRFAADTARFAIPAARLSIAYPASSTRRLVWLVGPSRAKDLLFSARTIDAAEAYRIGFVDRLFPAAELERATYAYLAGLSALAPRTQRVAKGIVDALTDDSAEALRAPLEVLVQSAFDSEDYAEGVRAFLEKRPPRFTGR